MIGSDMPSGDMPQWLAALVMIAVFVGGLALVAEILS